MTEQTKTPLPTNACVDGYCLVRVLSKGGSSIVYLATNEQGHELAIKEYFPRAVCLRLPGEERVRVNDAERPAFERGLKAFFDEAICLAKLKHHNVVHVLNFFRGNETAYMVMNFERGHNLQNHLRRYQAINPNNIQTVFVGVLSGLRAVHLAHYVHLDIKPSNIYLRGDGSPILLDFGAAQKAIVSTAQRFSPMYTPPFAAPELFSDSAGRAAIGPWTDLYSIGASMFVCLAGQLPQRADERQAKDEMAKRLIQLRGQSGCGGDELLDIIGWCLALEARARPQSAYALQKQLKALSLSNNVQDPF